MNVKDVMTTTPAYCTPETNLGAVVEIMWNRNCGFLPVIDQDKKVVSIITDRDICIAVGTRNILPGQLTVADVATQRAICCGMNDDARSALTKMAESRVRRLPVINAEGKLTGVISMDDIIEGTQVKRTVSRDGLTSEEVMSSLKQIYEPQLPARVSKKTAVN
jgi:CBS domain-containing protein